MKDRPRYTIELQAECVEATTGPDGFQALLAVETGCSNPLVVKVRVPTATLQELDATAEGAGQALADLSVERTREAVLKALGRSVQGSAVSLDTSPRISHADRARMLAELVKTRNESMTTNAGPDWLDRMLESEFAAVYADGEQKGYRACLPALATQPSFG